MDQDLPEANTRMAAKVDLGSPHTPRGVKDRLIRPGGYSVNSPVDLMRMLGNADRHLNSLFMGNTPLRALLEEFPAIHCVTASLIPFLNRDQLGVNDEQRALAQRHLQDNPLSFFIPAEL